MEDTDLEDVLYPAARSPKTLQMTDSSLSKRYPRLTVSRPSFALHLFRWPNACLRVTSQLFSPFIIINGLQENHHDNLRVLQCSFRIEADILVVLPTMLVSGAP